MSGVAERPEWWRLHYEDGSTEFERIGKDPRHLSVAELEGFCHRKEPLLRLIRRNCIDCAGGNEAEVRRCAIVACPFWPYRMATNPFAVPQSEGRRAASAERLRLARAKRAEFADLPNSASSQTAEKPSEGIGVACGGLASSNSAPGGQASEAVYQESPFYAAF